jgi:hypothetical protein
MAFDSFPPEENKAKSFERATLEWFGVVAESNATALKNWLLGRQEATDLTVACLAQTLGKRSDVNEQDAAYAQIT